MSHRVSADVLSGAVVVMKVKVKVVYLRLTWPSVSAGSRVFEPELSYCSVWRVPHYTRNT